jgi:hypothetical protein
MMLGDNSSEAASANLVLKVECQMSLRIRLILITTAAVVVLFGVSEWLSYQHAAALVDRHEAILMETADHTFALAKLKATRDSMFVSVTTVRICTRSERCCSQSQF